MSECLRGIARVLLFVVTFVIFVLGVVLLGLSIYSTVQSSHLAETVQSAAPSVVCGIAIGISILLIVVGFLGCCGTWKRHNVMLHIFAGILVVLVLAKVCIAIACFVQRHHVAQLVQQGLEKTRSDYLSDKLTMEAFNKLQADFACCGLDEPADWARIIKEDEVPFSCCAGHTGKCEDEDKASKCTPVEGYTNEDGARCVDASLAFTHGCVARVQEGLQSLLMMLAVAALVISVVLLLVAMLACWIARTDSLRQPDV